MLSQASSKNALSDLDPSETWSPPPCRPESRNPSPDAMHMLILGKYDGMEMVAPRVALVCPGICPRISFTGTPTDHSSAVVVVVASNFVLLRIFTAPSSFRTFGTWGPQRGDGEEWEC